MMPTDPFSTEALIARLNAAENPQEALEELRPGQRIRVQFGMVLRQLATAIRANPALGVRVFEIMERELERQVDAMIRPWEHRIARDAREDGRREVLDELRDTHPELFRDA